MVLCWNQLCWAYDFLRKIIHPSQKSDLLQCFKNLIFADPWPTVLVLALFHLEFVHICVYKKRLLTIFSSNGFYFSLESFIAYQATNKPSILGKQYLSSWRWLWSYLFYICHILILVESLTPSARLWEQAAPAIMFSWSSAASYDMSIPSYFKTSCFTYRGWYQMAR